MNTTLSTQSGAYGNVMQSEILSFTHAGGETTRYQVVVLQSFSNVHPIQGKTDGSTLEILARLCQVHLLPKCPELDALVLFTLPEETAIITPQEIDGEFIVDRESCARLWLNRAVTEQKINIQETRIHSVDADINTFLDELTAKQMLQLVQVRPGSKILFLPVSPAMGLLSTSYELDRISVNSHFFLMDLTDVETHYDTLGEPHGLLLIEGEVIQPPIYPRATLFLSRNGKSSIKFLAIENMGVEIDGRIYYHTETTPFYRRPNHAKSPCSNGMDIAIIGRRIVGYKKHGNINVPEAGFVLHCDNYQIPKKLSISYHIEGADDFGIQVGPAIVINGEALTDFADPYFCGTGVNFPPTVYPQGWSHGRAARVGLGIQEHRPVLIWVEGSKDMYYRKGQDSPGFTLAEFAALAKSLNLKNCINLDGGGSSQLTLGFKRALKIADRSSENLEELERPVPLGLSIEM